ncbi:hypothetical protein M422DRAFT_249158 [Sphaerobolus stellatus SS14]|nr:hypothetical protein M422DRAFT_249158 [Sphaerobolus stellatus SS14]
MPTITQKAIICSRSYPSPSTYLEKKEGVAKILGISGQMSNLTCFTITGTTMRAATLLRLLSTSTPKLEYLRVEVGNDLDIGELLSESEKQFKLLYSLMTLKILQISIPEYLGRDEDLKSFSLFTPSLESLDVVSEKSLYATLTFLITSVKNTHLALQAITITTITPQYLNLFTDAESRQPGPP